MITFSTLLTLVYIAGFVVFNIYILNGFFIKPNRLTARTDNSLILIAAMLLWPVTLVLMGVGVIKKV